jgi:hypothetical protein
MSGVTGYIHIVLVYTILVFISNIQLALVIL